MKYILPILFSSFLSAQTVRIDNTGPFDFRGYVRATVDTELPGYAGLMPLNCGMCVTINPAYYVAAIAQDGDYQIDIECTVPANSNVFVDISTFTTCTRPLPWMVDNPEPLWGGMPKINGNYVQWRVMELDGAGHRIRCTGDVDNTFSVVLDFVYRPTAMSYISGNAYITAHGWNGPSLIYSVPNGITLTWGNSNAYVLASPNTQFNHMERVTVPFTMIWPNLMTTPIQTSSAQAIFNRHIIATQI